MKQKEHIYGRLIAIFSNIVKMSIYLQNSFHINLIIITLITMSRCK